MIAFFFFILLLFFRQFFSDSVGVGRKFLLTSVTLFCIAFSTLWTFNAFYCYALHIELMQHASAHIGYLPETSRALFQLFIFNTKICMQHTLICTSTLLCSIMNRTESKSTRNEAKMAIKSRMDKKNSSENQAVSGNDTLFARSKRQNWLKYEKSISDEENDDDVMPFSMKIALRLNADSVFRSHALDLQLVLHHHHHFDQITFYHIEF